MSHNCLSNKKNLNNIFWIYTKMYSSKPVMQMLEKDEFTLKGAGGEISFNTVIQDRTVAWACAC